MTLTSPVAQRASQKRAYQMAALLGGMGILHFVAPKPFDSIIPVELPGTARFYTYASGVGELGTAALLAVPSTRKLGATAAVALFLAVLPGNVNMVRLFWDKPWYLKAVTIARLPLQVPMITLALKVRRDA